jgi:hypothetical protein
MSTTTPPPPPAPIDDVDDVDDPPRRGITVGRVLATAVCLGFVLMWAFVFANQNSYQPAGQLDDTTFPEAAEPICKAARDAIDELPPSRSAKSPAERADTIVEATDHLTEMQRQLKEIAPAGTGEAAFVRQWVDDWKIFIQDRYDYAVLLRTKGDAEFLVSEKYGTQLSKSMDNFAQVNFMESCKVPGDV